MNSRSAIRKLVLAVLVASGLSFGGRAVAADIKGQVLDGGAPIANSTVTLWAASADVPKQIAQAKTGDDGRFVVHALGTGGAVAVKGKRSGASSSTSTPTNAILYLVATGGQPKASKTSGDNPAIVLITVVGSNPPASVVSTNSQPWHRFGLTPSS